jgi:hypothetical protein
MESGGVSLFQRSATTQLRRLILGGLLMFGLTCPTLASATPWTLSAPTTISYSNTDLPQANLQQVGCSAPGTCTAVGVNGPPGGTPTSPTGTFDMVAAQEVNGAWGPATAVSSVSIGNPNGTANLSLSGIACTSPGTCIAIGTASTYTNAPPSYTSTSTYEPFYVTEHGGVWGGMQPIAFPADAYIPTNPAFAGSTADGSTGDLACASAGHCVAMGEYDMVAGPDGAPGSSLVGMASVGSVNGFASYQGTSLSGTVACVPQSTTCTVLGEGSAGGYPQLAVETESGGAWSPAQTITSGAGANGQGTLPEGGIACPAAGDCVVSGDYPSTYATEDLFALQETNGTWGTPQEIGDGESPEGGFIYGDMACISVGNCIWGGQSEQTQGSGPNTYYYKQAVVADETDGTWSGFSFSPMPASAVPPPNSYSTSQAVSCAGNRCDLAGFYTTQVTTTPPIYDYEVPYAFSVMQGSLYKVSGSVSTSSACGCGGVPIADGTVLVTGTAADGTPVSQAAVTNTSGEWSVMVPNGSYTAGPSLDGSTFADLPSFDPERRDNIAVNGADVPDQDFVTCIQEPDGSSSSPDMRRPGGPSASAAAVAPAKPCISQYTITLKASIPQGELIDPSADAHYRIDPTTDNVGYPKTDYWFEHYLRETRLTRQLASLPTFPNCPAFSNERVKQLTKDNAEIRWFSEFAGKTQLGSATVTMAWDQTTQTMQLVSAPTYVTTEMTRTYHWDLQESGKKPQISSCSVSEPVQVMLAPVLSDAAGAEGKLTPQDFTLIASWDFPFDSAGLKLDADDTTAGQSVVEIAHEFKEFLEAHPNVKLLYDTGSLVATFVGIGKLLHAVKAASIARAVAFFTGEGKAAVVKAIAGAVNVAHAFFYKHDAVEAYDIFKGLMGWDDEGGGYPLMSAVVRGHFHTSTTDYGKVEGAHDVYATDRVPTWTTLAVSAATTKFPNIAMTITRVAATNPNQNIETYSGILPWRSTTGVPNTKNLFVNNSHLTAFGLNPPYLLNNSSPDTYRYGAAALKRLLAAFRAMKPVQETMREYKQLVSEETFGTVQALAPPPTCSDTEGNPQPSSAHTICWQFTDGVA